MRCYCSARGRGRPRSIGTSRPVRRYGGVVDDSGVGIVTIRRFGDLQAVGDRYRGHLAVEVCLHRADDDLARRVLDFATGLVQVDGGAVTALDQHRYRLVPGEGSEAGPAGGREPRSPHPMAGADGALAPVPDHESYAADAINVDAALVPAERDG